MESGLKSGRVQLIGERIATHVSQTVVSHDSEGLVDGQQVGLEAEEKVVPWTLEERSSMMW